MLQTFIPVFCMTFFICLFIVLMQFLWQQVDDLVGKGLDMKILAELFFYAGLSFAPLALPLAILLASLMTFGNLAERLELLSMKAAGVSLIRIMTPLILVVSFIAVGAFFFQNEVLPRAQVKMFSLLFSMRHKSPELDIPEGVFYKEIDGYNIYVKKKNPQTGMLYDVMIYNYSGSFEDAGVYVADSAKLKMTDDKQFLYLTLYNGESFENLKDQRGSKSNVPYRRESFSKKEVLIEFDANFNRMDESVMAGQYVGKNIAKLKESIDSLTVKRDSITGTYATALVNSTYITNVSFDAKDDSIIASSDIKDLSLDSIYNSLSIKTKESILSKSQQKVNNVRQDYGFKETIQRDDNKTIRRHEIEMHKKFSLSFACLVFFFIGAPLGAIIGKGGLGMPVIVSIFLFIVYYVIDNTGVKMSRDGNMAVWEGMWMSSAILLPLGIFFTYKAVNDSVLFSFDTYLNFMRNVFGIQKKRLFEKKEVIIESVKPSEYVAQIESLNQVCEKYIEQSTNKMSKNFIYFFEDKHQAQGWDDLIVKYNIFFETGSNADNNKILLRLSDYPVLFKINFGSPTHNNKLGIIIALLLPFSIPYYIFAMYKRKKRLMAISSIIEKNKELIQVIKETYSLD